MENGQRQELIQRLPITISYREIQEHFGISRVTVWKLRKAGKFPEPVQVGSQRHRWDSQAIVNWYEERQKAAAEQENAA